MCAANFSAIGRWMSELFMAPDIGGLAMDLVLQVYSYSVGEIYCLNYSYQYLRNLFYYLGKFGQPQQQPRSGN